MGQDVQVWWVVLGTQTQGLSSFRHHAHTSTTSRFKPLCHWLPQFRCALLCRMLMEVLLLLSWR